MNDTRLLAYVETMAALLKLPLDAARAQRVAVHLQRTAAMAALLEAAPLTVHDELAEIYRPAAFPPNDDGREQL
ncbi:AtzG-like protein [Polaromonas sp.]|uniref:AtzG-like protein n=1 Tax=Polaromonas sp. TaxID=1869339 RepID=UPI003265D186